MDTSPIIKAIDKLGERAAHGDEKARHELHEVAAHGQEMLYRAQLFHARRLTDAVEGLGLTPHQKRQLRTVLKKGRHAIGK